MSVNDVSSNSVGTLANAAALEISGPAMTRGGRLLSIKGLAAIQALTAGDGPFLFGIMQQGVSTTFLKEYLEIDGPLSPDAVVPAEQSSRGAIIRVIGALIPSGDGTVAASFMNNISMKGLRFTEEGLGWAWWLYNLGKAATTGATFQVASQCFVEFNPSG